MATKTETPAKSLAEALSRIYAAVGYVQKAGTMRGSGGNYSYATEAGFIRALRPHLVEQGVTIAPVAMQIVLHEVVTTRSGANMNRTVVLVTYRFIHAGSGESLDVQALGEGMDTGDKSCNKAMTGAMKYALRQAFVVETGDDPDEHPSDEQERRHAPPPRQEPKGYGELQAALDAARNAKDEQALRVVCAAFKLQGGWLPEEATAFGKVAKERLAKLTEKVTA